MSKKEKDEFYNTDDELLEAAKHGTHKEARRAILTAFDLCADAVYALGKSGMGCTALKRLIEARMWALARVDEKHLPAEECLMGAIFGKEE